MTVILAQIAEEIALHIDYENGILSSAQWEQERLPPSREARQRQLFRDKKRSESKIMAFKEALDIVLKADDSEQNAEEYMAHRPSTRQM